MIYLYVFTLVLGGVLLGASMLLGTHDEGGADSDIETDGDLEGFLFGLLSVRFWTFFCAFFGLTGVVLDGLGLVSHWAVATTLAVVMGAAAGFGATWLLRTLRGDGSNSVGSSSEMIGKSARVLVSAGPEQVGKVRIELRGTSVDMLAISIDGETHAPRSEVLVIELDGTRVKVASLDFSLSTNESEAS